MIEYIKKLFQKSSDEPLPLYKIGVGGVHEVSINPNGPLMSVIDNDMYWGWNYKSNGRITHKHTNIGTYIYYGLLTLGIILLIGGKK